uniref:Uncharacterized protein n=1 Tax=Panagrolaimus superbus TaxID=310955 RepID=A0A914YKG3_9BILA
MVATLFDELISLRKISSSLKDQVETLENFGEQLASVSRVGDDYEVVKKYPEWKNRLKAALFLEVTDSMETFSKSLNLLAKIIQRLESLFEESRHREVSDSHESDLITFVSHLRSIYFEYSNFTTVASEEFTQISEGKRTKLDIKKRSLYDESFEIRSSYQRLKEDFKKFVVE